MFMWLVVKTFLHCEDILGLFEGSNWVLGVWIKWLKLGYWVEECIMSSGVGVKIVRHMCISFGLLKPLRATLNFHRVSGQRGLTGITMSHFCRLHGNSNTYVCAAGVN